jgi:hypothetical protein
MNNESLRAWLEKEADDKRDSCPFNQYDDGWYDCVGAVLDRLDPNPEPGSVGMDPAMRAELERIASEPESITLTRREFARHLLDTYGTEREKVCEWERVAEVEGEEGLWLTGCNTNSLSRSGYAFCPFCGGRIQEVEEDE